MTMFTALFVAVSAVTLADDEAAKLAAKLKVPAGLTEPAETSKLPKSGWSSYSASKVGDFVELQIAGITSRTEIFDLADRAVTLRIVTTIKAGTETIKSESATKMVFAGPDAPPAAVEATGTRVVNKASDRKFTVGAEEVVADKLTETYMGDKLQARTWTSAKLPAGAILLMEDGGGNVLMKLIGYGRGK